MEEAEVKLDCQACQPFLRASMPLGVRGSCCLSWVLSLGQMKAAQSSLCPESPSATISSEEAGIGQGQTSTG